MAQKKTVTSGGSSLGGGQAGAVAEGEDVGELVVLQRVLVDIHPALRVHQGAGSDDVRGRHRGRDVQEVVL